MCRLTFAEGWDYSNSAPAKSGAWFGRQELKADTAAERFFCVRSMASLFGRAVREPFGAAGFLEPVDQPARFRSPSWSGVAEVNSVSRSAAMAAQYPSAHPLFQIGEEVLVHGEYGRGIATVIDFAWHDKWVTVDSDEPPSAGYSYFVFPDPADTPDIPWPEEALQKRFQPSDCSFKKLLRDLKRLAKIE